ncbi:hypothetical protein [Candidatus Ichthyocystis sparus]|uniref:hypothetical protein n=1 Tax=Candidatus Ichthyocystis sparus TaxID=1561004 RepID=UPI000B814E5F|nr:hypothetical protein [Candidatus Ichthyocystis sparus]
MNLPMFLATLDIADPDNFALFDRSDIILFLISLFIVVAATSSIVRLLVLGDHLDFYPAIF